MGAVSLAYVLFGNYECLTCCAFIADKGLNSSHALKGTMPVGGHLMHDYEIRVLSSGHAISVVEVRQLNDHTAIRSGRKIAADRPFQVWKGIECIYGRSRTTPAGGID